MGFMKKPPVFTLEEAQGVAHRTIDMFKIDVTEGTAITNLDERATAQLAELMVEIVFQKVKREKSQNQKLFDSTVQSCSLRSLWRPQLSANGRATRHCIKGS